MKMVAATTGKVVAKKETIIGLGNDLDSFDPKYLEIMIRRLRTKAQAEFNFPLPLETIHGEGLAFTAAIQIV